MKKLILAAATLMLTANFALAQTAAPAEGKKAPSEKQLRQQEKMKNCNKEAKDKQLKGDARKQFMSECLKAGKSAGAAAPAKPAAPATPAKKQ